MASSSTSAKVNDKNSLRNEIKPEPQEASNLVLLTDNEKSESAIEIGKRKRDQLIGSDHQNILTVLDENRNSIVKFFDNDLDDDVEDADAARKYSRRFTSRETSDYSYYRAIGSLKCEMSKFVNIEVNRSNPDQFLLGAHTIKLEKIPIKISYPNVSRATKSNIKHIQLYTKNESGFFLNISMQNFNEIELFYRIDMSLELTSSIFELAAMTIVLLELESCDFEKQTLQVNVKFHDRVNKSAEITEEPSMIKSPLRIGVNKYWKNLIRVLKEFSLLSHDEIEELDGEINVKDRQENKDQNTSKEKLYDLVYERRGELSVADIENQEIQSRSDLKLQLRPYQIDAVRWMLAREKMIADQPQPEQHPLYVKITNTRGHTIYWHKIFGIYTRNKPIKDISMAGGILADEMGLGKTIEVLALISVNRRPTGYELIKNEPTEPENVAKAAASRKKRGKTTERKMFSCLCDQPPAGFQVHIDQDVQEILESSDLDVKIASPLQTEKETYICTVCGVYSHPKCLNYDGDENEFKCLQCCVKEPLESGCTLIVTPASICAQWREEIEKHTRTLHTRMQTYEGFRASGFRPFELAKLNICLTTYEVLAAELERALSFEVMGRLRRPKRFLNKPSPLQCIKWWRVCFDEAQMLHANQAKCAEMADRLASSNRWCVTGTPIGFSFSDLFTLFMFIREDPYKFPRWFSYEMDKFLNGSTNTLTKVVSSVMWRTLKRHVEKDLNIPKQTERIVLLDFSPLEAHLYERLLESFRQQRKRGTWKRQRDNQSDDETETEMTDENNVEKFFKGYSDDTRLDEIIDSRMEILLQPLISLRKVCNHPALLQKFSNCAPRTNDRSIKQTGKNRDLLTMDASFQILLDSTQAECDKHFKSCVNRLEALARLSVLMGDPKTAADIYERVLSLANTKYNGDVSLDRLQKVHVLQNYVDLLSRQDDDVVAVETDRMKKLEWLRSELSECERSYLASFHDNAIKSAKMYTEIEETVQLEIKQKQKNMMMSVLALLSILEASDHSGEFWETKLSRIFNESDTTCDSTSVRKSYMMLGRSVASYGDLKSLFESRYVLLFETREQLVMQIKELQRKQQDLVECDKMLQRFVECHVRSRLNSCEMCKSEKVFKTYSSLLFTNSEEALKRTKQLASNDEIANLVSKRKEDFENLCLVLMSYCKKPLDAAAAENSTLEMKKLYNDLRDLSESFKVLKEEFFKARAFWFDLDDLVVAKQSLLSGKNPLEIDLNYSKSTQSQSGLTYEQDLRDQFKTHKIKLNNENLELKNSLKNLSSLKNMKKSNELDQDNQKPDTCPQCLGDLISKWYVLQCGHMYCPNCYQEIIKSHDQTDYETAEETGDETDDKTGDKTHENRSNTATTSGTTDDRYVKCLVCYQISKSDQSYLINTKSKNTKESVINEHSNNSDNMFDREFDLSTVEIEDDTSAKVEGIVKLLIKILKIDPTAKCIIFSEHLRMLRLISDLLETNKIEYVMVTYNKFQERNVDKLVTFRKDSSKSVLLMPYAQGANGLNLIEATHVVLVEPTLDRGQEFQAMGRIHRIGQTKPTYIYRFMIKNTIEEVVYNLFKSSNESSATTQDTASASSTIKSKMVEWRAQTEVVEPLCVRDLKHLFLSL